MREVVTVKDMRRLEQAAVEVGVSYASLMQRAGEAAARSFCAHFSKDDVRGVLVLCGNGNNGGDGFVIARALAEYGYDAVTVLLVSGPPMTAPAAEMFERLRDTAVTVFSFSDTAEDKTLLESPAIATATHIVDAVYGIGFRGHLPTSQRALFSVLSSKACPVLAVDIPSGINADDGTFDSAALSATVTVTFTAEKPAVLVEDAASKMGEIEVADVGIAPSLVAAYTTPMAVIDEAAVRAAFLPRPSDSHKGTFGRLLSVCGSYGMVGAALMAGKAALRSGVGLLDMALPCRIYPIAAGQLWEAVFHPLEETSEGVLDVAAFEKLSLLSKKASAVLVGCGLSCCASTAALLQKWLPTLTVPTVLDADGLNMISLHIVTLKAMNAPCILTPHPAEMARLMQCSIEQVQRDRIGAAKMVATEYNAVVVLKGHRTVIASPDGAVYLNCTGCSGMATGGSGDVLSGMIASFAAQGMPPLEAALAGVYLHGLAGQLAAVKRSETAMLPTDMIEELATLLSHYEKRE